jgi:hypothetical protein
VEQRFGHGPAPLLPSTNSEVLMARRSPQTAGKREREQAKREKRERKEERRAANASKRSEEALGPVPEAPDEAADAESPSQPEE